MYNTPKYEYTTIVHRVLNIALIYIVSSQVIPDLLFYAAQITRVYSIRRRCILILNARKRNTSTKLQKYYIHS